MKKASRNKKEREKKSIIKEIENKEKEDGGRPFPRRLRPRNSRAILRAAKIGRNKYPYAQKSDSILRKKKGEMGIPMRKIRVVFCAKNGGGNDQILEVFGIIVRKRGIYSLFSAKHDGRLSVFTTEELGLVLRKARKSHLILSKRGMVSIFFAKKENGMDRNGAVGQTRKISCRFAQNWKSEDRYGENWKILYNLAEM